MTVVQAHGYGLKGFLKGGEQWLRTVKVACPGPDCDRCKHENRRKP